MINALITLWKDPRDPIKRRDFKKYMEMAWEQINSGNVKDPKLYGPIQLARYLMEAAETRYG
jgi:hypothetical protein